MVNGYGYHLPDRIINPAKMVQTPTAGVLFLWVCRDILVISDSAMLPFSATGGGRKTTLMKGGVCVEYIAVIVIFTFLLCSP